MFAAVIKGRGKGQLATVLGARKIKDLCAELEQNNSFTCKKVWATGACGEVLLSAIATMCTKQELQDVLPEARATWCREM